MPDDAAAGPISGGASGDVARLGIAAAAWNYLGNAAKALSQFVVAVVLARLLGPETFGVVAVGWIVIGAAGLFGDLGFGAAIVQRTEIAKRDVDFAFTMQLAASLVFTLAVIVAAPWIARFFGQPQATNVIRAMAASLVLRTFGQTPTALLQRELRFRATQTIAVASYVLGFGGVGFLLAWLGFGAWSLVGAQLVQTAASSLAVLVLTRHRPALALRAAHPDIARTGSLVIAANLGSWAIANVDTIIVGHVGGPLTLGLYNRATALATMPVSSIVGGLQGVILSTASRIQTDKARVRSALFGCIALFLLFGGSALTTLALVADTVVTGLLGHAWREAAPMLSALSIAMLLHGVLAFAGPVLTATGHVRKEARVQWLMLPAMAALVYVAARQSAVAAAWAVVACYALRLILLYRKVDEDVPLGWVAARRTLLPPLGAALATGLVTKLADELLWSAGPVPRLAADMAVAALALGAGIVVTRARLARGPLGAVLRSSAIVPPWLRAMASP